MENKVEVESLDTLVKQLTLEHQNEVRDFAEFLLQKHRRKPGVYLKQDWAGSLRSYRDQYTSLELQKKALDWWVQ